jgi:uncharacterized repeat protein (TIGR01451 family)
MNRSLKTAVSISVSSLLVGTQLLWQQPTANAQTFINTNNFGCPTGTLDGPTNFVRNGNFASTPGITGLLPPNNPAQFTSTLPYRGDFLYPDDGGTFPGSLNAFGGLSIQQGIVEYLANPTPPPAFIVRGEPFPGDPRFNVPPSNTYLYSNPNAAATTPLISGSAFPSPTIWEQDITGVSPNAVYNFTAYFFNLLNPGAPGADPIILEQVGPVGGAPATFVPPINTPGIVVSDRQTWLGPTNRVAALFRTSPGQTSLTLRIIDQADDIIGDDFGLTAIAFRECVPTLSVTKAVGTPQQNADGTVTIPYTVNVTNNAPPNSAAQDYGNGFTINSVQIVEDLRPTFANATLNSVTNVQSPTLTINSGFNGTSDVNLLAAGNTLPAASTATVTFNAIITPGPGEAGVGPFDNEVTASGVSQGGTPLNPPPARTRVTTSRPETGGGGNPQFVLVKRITSVTRNGALLPGVNFGEVINDPTNTNDDDPAWAQFPPAGVIDVSPNNPVRGGDIVTYTVYFLSNGQTPALDTSICDPIPQGTALVPLSGQVQVGSTGTPQAGGTVYTPLAPLPANNPCPDQRNPNGAIIFNLGDLTNTPTNNIGFVRFQVRIQ